MRSFCMPVQAAAQTRCARGRKRVDAALQQRPDSCFNMMSPQRPLTAPPPPHRMLQSETTTPWRSPADCHLQLTRTRNALCACGLQIASDTERWGVFAISYRKVDCSLAIPATEVRLCMLSSCSWWRG